MWPSKQTISGKKKKHAEERETSVLRPRAPSPLLYLPVFVIPTPSLTSHQRISQTPAPPIPNPAPAPARSDAGAPLLTESSGSGGDAGEPAGGAPGGGAAAGAGRGGAGAGAGAGAGGGHRAPARGADEGSAGGAGDARGAGSTPRAGLLRRRRTRRHGVHQRLPVRLRLQLPCRRSHFAVLVEPFASLRRHLCTSCQAIFKECSSCMYIYYRRWDHRYTNPGRSMCVSRNHCSHW